MHSFNDPLFSAEYFQPAQIEETYLLSKIDKNSENKSSFISIFDNPILPTEDELSNAENIIEFFRSERGKAFIEFKDQLIQALASWSIKNEIVIKDDTFAVFNRYFNSNNSLGTKIINLYKQGIPYLDALVKAIHSEHIPIYLRKTVVNNLITSGIQVCEEGMTDNIQTAFQELTTNVANRLMTIRRNIASAVIKDYLHSIHPCCMETPSMEIHIIKYFLQHFNDILCLTLTDDHYAIDKNLTDDNSIKNELRSKLMHSLCSWRIMRHVYDSLDLDNQLQCLNDNIHENNEVEIENILNRIMSELLVYGTDEFFTRYHLLEYNEEYKPIGIANFAKHAILISLQQRLIAQGQFSEQYRKLIPLTKFSFQSSSPKNSSLSESSHLSLAPNGENPEGLPIASISKMEMEFTEQFFQDDDHKKKEKKETMLCFYEKISDKVELYNHLFSHAHVFDPKSNTRLPFLAYYYQEVILTNNQELEKCIIQTLDQRVKADHPRVVRLFHIMSFFHEFFTQVNVKNTLHIQKLIEQNLMAAMDACANDSNDYVKDLLTLRVVLNYLIPLQSTLEIKKTIQALNTMLVSKGIEPLDVENLCPSDANFFRFVSFLLDSQSQELQSLKPILSEEFIKKLELCCKQLIDKLSLSKLYLADCKKLVMIKSIYNLQTLFLPNEIITTKFYQIMAQQIVKLHPVYLNLNLNEAQKEERNRIAISFLKTLVMLTHFLHLTFVTRLIQTVDPDILRDYFTIITTSNNQITLRRIYVTDHIPLMLIFMEHMKNYPTDIRWLIDYNLMGLLKNLYKYQNQCPQLLSYLPGPFCDAKLLLQCLVTLFKNTGNTEEGINYKKFLITHFVNKVTWNDQADEPLFREFIGEMPAEIAKELQLILSAGKKLQIYLDATMFINQTLNPEERNRCYLLTSRLLQLYHLDTIESFLNVETFLKQAAISDLSISPNLEDLLRKLFFTLSASHSPEQATLLMTEFFRNCIGFNFSYGIEANMQEAQRLFDPYRINVLELMEDKILKAFALDENLMYIRQANNLYHFLGKIDINKAIHWMSQNVAVVAKACNTEKRLNDFSSLIHRKAQMANAQDWCKDYLQSLNEYIENDPSLRKRKKKKVPSQQGMSNFFHKKPDTDDDTGNNPKRRRTLSSGMA